MRPAGCFADCVIGLVSTRQATKTLERFEEQLLLKDLTTDTRTELREQALTELLNHRNQLDRAKDVLSRVLQDNVSARSALESISESSDAILARVVQLRALNNREPRNKKRGRPRKN